MPSFRAGLPDPAIASEVRRATDRYLFSPGPSLLLTFSLQTAPKTQKGPRLCQGPFAIFAASLGWPELLLPALPRLAPRERCVQRCFAFKPGGVIRPLRSSMSSPSASTPRVDGPQGDFYNFQRADLCPLPSIDYAVDFLPPYLMKSVSRNWSRLTYDFMVRNLPNISWISRF